MNKNFETTKIINRILTTKKLIKVMNKQMRPYIYQATITGLLFTDKSVKKELKINYFELEHQNRLVEIFIYLRKKYQIESYQTERDLKKIAGRYGNKRKYKNIPNRYPDL